MGLTEIRNGSPFAFAPLFTLDEHGRSVLVPIVKATYDMGPGTRLSLADQQEPVNLVGKRCGPEEHSSYMFEPEIAPTKLATDVVLIGSAHAKGGRYGETYVRLQVGPLEKAVRVVGDRKWVKRIGGAIRPTDPEPFERIPLTYERAFGGWDRSDPDPDRHTFDPRNPVGTGFVHRRGAFVEGIRLPNVEHPQHPLTRFGDAVPPAGFGFVSPDWQPRASLAGTFDDAWARTRMPLLPLDFDKRFFSAASEGLVSKDHLKGDEPVLIQNVAAAGDLSFRLPGVPHPQCKVRFDSRQRVEVETRLDTVIIDSDAKRLMLLWRPSAAIPAEPQKVTFIRIRVQGVPIHVQ